MSLSFSPLRRRFLDPTRGLPATEPRAREIARTDDRRSLTPRTFRTGRDRVHGPRTFPVVRDARAVAALARVSMARMDARGARRALRLRRTFPDGVRECDVRADRSFFFFARPPSLATLRSRARGGARDALRARRRPSPSRRSPHRGWLSSCCTRRRRGTRRPDKLRVAAEKTLAVTGTVSDPTRRAVSGEGHLGSARSRAARAPRARPCEPRAERIRVARWSPPRPKAPKARGDESDGAKPSSPAADGGSRSASRRFNRTAAVFEGERFPERRGPRRRARGGLRRGRARRRETRAREEERPNEPSFADEMENRLPGKPDVGAELVTAGA